MLITFSGIDGAGKTTLIEHLRSTLEGEGRHVKVLTMYDDMSFYALLRKARGRFRNFIGVKAAEPGSTLSQKVAVEFDAANLHDPKIGASDKKGLDKIVYSVARSVLVRKLMLFLDLLIVSVYRFYFEAVKKNILVTDRYLYDTLADVADLKSRDWLFIRLFMRLIRHAEIPILVDLSPEEAFTGKKEYPVRYLRWRQATYKKIFGWIPGAIMIQNDNLAASGDLLNRVVKKILVKLTEDKRS